MSELKLKSTLSMEEIESNFENMDMFSSLLDGLEEALAYSNGKDHSLVDKLQYSHA